MGAAQHSRDKHDDDDDAQRESVGVEERDGVNITHSFISSSSGVGGRA